MKGYPLGHGTHGPFPDDLPPGVYGPGWRHWHDHHLRLEGPVVATIEQQFAERWIIPCSNVYLFDRSSTSIGGDDQVQLTSASAISNGQVRPLPTAAPAPVAGSSAVQMWRTIPLREVNRGPFLRGKFTVAGGVANAIKQARRLITIWDQYFWSEPVARLLGSQVGANPDLLVLIVLPPYGSSDPANELWYRRRALQTLRAAAGGDVQHRISVLNMWARPLNTGIYVHAKCQTYDDRLLVVGSANLNRRSTECDAELDCAVADPAVVRTHLQNLYNMLHPGGPWPGFDGDWAARFWSDLTVLPGPLIGDPFWLNTHNPKTPNGVNMSPGFFLKPESLFEPSSIGRAPQFEGVEQSTCPFPDPAVPDPRVVGSLDEVTYLLEHCREAPTRIDPLGWPWRYPA
jgi:phosphatidylserine/phosphatidylglycerophosphate/cardiolipin synthase-like enzyme